MGIPDEPFWSPPEVVDAYREATRRAHAEDRARWLETLDAVDADERAAWDAAWQASGLKGWEDALPTFEQGEKIATRQAIAKAFAASFPNFPGLVSGAADLTGNTGVKLPDTAGTQGSESPGGRQVYYGIREHAMGGALVGMARHGGILPIGGTFFAFLDYMREPVRLASLSRAKAVFVFSHDSVGVGEDGPTHQPVEHIATLRAVPDLQVIRPADANETMAAWRAAVDHDGPTALVLTRQGVPVRTDGSAVERGAGIVRESDGEPALVIVATGSEVALAIAAADQLNVERTATRVVSLPSWDRFARQDGSYRRSLFPDGVPVLSVEAATTFGWERYADDCIGIDRFGASAPGDVVLDELGINLAHVLERARALIA
jgi:transketolase